MGDIYVHERMQRCCRDELARLDEVRAKVGSSRPPVRPLGEKTALAAIGSLPPEGSHGPAAEEATEPLADVLRATSRRASLRHAQAHAARSERAEATFWSRLAETF